MKVALVTGGGSGIGLGISRDLAQQGFLVLVSDINLDAAQETVDSITSEGFKAVPVQLDITNQQAVDELPGWIESEFGRLDLLVNNAGIQFVSRLEDFPPDRWRMINEVLLVGPVMLTRAVLPLMNQQGYGRIVNIGSIHGLVASPFKTAYVAAKHGLIGFSKVMALELADRDITINTICPAYVKTALVEKQIADTAKQHNITEDEVVNNIMLQPMPKKSFIDIAEICGSVNFLISDAAKNMTGQTIVLDGGWVAR